MFCPLFRIHGRRLPALEDNTCGKSGGSNEVWNFGNESYSAIRKVMEIRETLRPYIHDQFKENSISGMPIMRPLFVDFPNDEIALNIEDQAMFGSSYLIAPQMVPLNISNSRRLYLPKLETGTWRDFFSSRTYSGGQWISIVTHLDTFPLFIR